MICECIFCGHKQNEEFKEKTTIRCNRCARPTDWYEDGRAEISPLYYVIGPVNGDDPDNVCTGFGGILSVRTLEKDLKK